MSENKENTKPVMKRKIPWVRHHNPGTRYTYDGPRTTATSKINVLSNIVVVPPRTVPYDPRKHAIIPVPNNPAVPRKLRTHTSQTPKRTAPIPETPRRNQRQVVPRRLIPSQKNEPQTVRPKHPRITAPSPPRRLPVKERLQLPRPNKPRRQRHHSRSRRRHRRNKRRSGRPQRRRGARQGPEYQPPSPRRHLVPSRVVTRHRPSILDTPIPWHKPHIIEVPNIKPIRRIAMGRIITTTMPWEVKKVDLPKYEAPKVYDATGRDPRSQSFRVVINIPPPDIPRRWSRTPPTPRVSPLPSPVSPLPATP